MASDLPAVPLTASLSTESTLFDLMATFPEVVGHVNEAFSKAIKDVGDDVTPRSRVVLELVTWKEDGVRQVSWELVGRSAY